MTKKKSDKGDVFPKELPVSLSDDELRFRGLELSKQLGKIDDLTDELKKLKDEQKPKREKIDERIEDLREQLDNKAEDRKVQCQEIYRYAQRVAVTIRLDTAEEIDTRALQPNEMQSELTLLPGQGKSDEASGEKE